MYSLRMFRMGKGLAEARMTGTPLSSRSRMDRMASRDIPRSLLVMVPSMSVARALYDNSTRTRLCVGLYIVSV